METRARNRLTFNLAGTAIVIFWLCMVGLQVKKNYVHSSETGPVSALGTPRIESAQREWKEISLKGKKVGYAVNLIKPFEDGYFVQEEIFLKLNLMGLGGGVYTVTRSRVDKEFLLKSFEFVMTSGAVTFKLTGRVEGDTLFVESGRGRDRRTQTVRLSRPPMIGSSMGHYFRFRDLKVGETFRFPLFDPSTMAQKEVEIRVADREKIDIRGVSYDAFRLEAAMWGQTMRFWVDKEGYTLREDGFMGLTMTRSSAARAPRDIEQEGDVDFYDLTAVAVEKSLPRPDRLTYLKLKLSNIEHMAGELAALNSERQTYSGGILEIRKEDQALRPSYRLPHEFGADMQAFLRPEFNIESDHEEIRKQAEKIAGSHKNPIAVARMMMNWVYKNLEKRPVVSIPSALEVLRTRVGDCNEHATLLTALLRASGIPARLSIGLVYTRDKFYYHAWNEVWLGKWVSMDATLDQMPADVTHIKLVEGNLDKQVEIAGFIGTMKIEVMDHKR